LIHFYALANNVFFFLSKAQGVLDGYEKIDGEA
jgi:hypothetical protein